MEQQKQNKNQEISTKDGYNIPNNIWRSRK